MLLVTTTGKCDIVLKCKSICADFTVNIIDYDYHIIEHLDVHHIHVTVLNITIVFVVNIFSKVERPVTLKKEGIQTRNRKLSSKSKKSKRRGGVGGGAGSIVLITIIVINLLNFVNFIITITIITAIITNMYNILPQVAWWTSSEPAWKAPTDLSLEAWVRVL